MNARTIGIGAATVAAGAVVAAGVIAGGSNALADPSTNPTASPSSTTGGSETRQGRGASSDTPVTGDEAAKVSAAVTAKDAAVTVESVRKDPDGSYDVLGTKDGSPVMFDVSADLATVTEHTGAGGGRGGRGASSDTPVTGDEAARVSAAVTAKDAAVTVESVRKDPDGSYDVLGTKDGSPVMFDVSADLATVTEHTGAGGGRGGRGASSDTPVTGDEAAKVSAAVTAKDAAVTVDSVRKDPDGSYDVLGTKDGSPVMFDVSADLKTITENSHTGR